MNESKRIRQEQQLNNSYSLLDEEERIGNDVCGVDWRSQQRAWTHRKSKERSSLMDLFESKNRWVLWFPSIYVSDAES